MLGLQLKSGYLTRYRNLSSSLQGALQRADWSKIIITIFIACFIVLINLAEVVRLPELLVYDKLVYYSHEKTQPNHVLLLEVSPEQLNESPKLVGDIIDSLLLHSPKHIVMMQSLEQFGQEDLHSWLENKQVDYTPTVYRTFQDGGHVDYQYRSSAALKTTTPLGFALPVNSNYGIARAIPHEIIAPEGVLHSFQTQLTPTQPNSEKELYINFNQGTSTIPRYRATKLLKVGIIEALVKDKIILVIPAPDDFMPGLITPANNYSEPLLPYYVQAMALNSLLNQSDIQMMDPWQSAAICFIFFISFLFTFQWLNIRFGTLIILTSSVLLLIFDWYLISFHYFYAPILSFSISIITALLTAIPLHRVTEQKVFDELRLGILSQLKSKKTPHSFYEVDDPWNHIIVFINQHLFLKRSILLERVENDHRVKEIKSLGCNIDDIAEQRRDYTRHPYDTSIQQQIPLDLQGRHYFKESIEGEKQFLIPLRLENEILGFWALTIIPDETWDQNKFFADINVFASQIAQLLHSRQTFNIEDKINNKLFTQLLNFNLGLNNHKSLKSAVDGLGHHLRIMEGIFDGMSSAAMLYDLFGKIISSNDLMDQLAKDSQFSIYELTSLDLISKACGISPDDARKRLRHVAMHSESIDLPLASLIENRQYLLRIRSIKPKNENNKRIKDNGLPFELLGILFEFINVTPIQQRFTTDIVVYENLNSILRNNLSSLALCQLQLSLSPAADTDILGQMNQTIQHSTEIVTNAEKLLSYSSNKVADTAKLLHPLDVLNRTLIELKDPMRESQLTFNTTLPVFTGLIFIGEDALNTLLLQSLKLLIEDAIPNTEINISLNEQQREDELHHTGSIIIVMRNSGYGVPQKELSIDRKNSNYIETDSLSLFKKSIINVSAWQVIVTSTSHVGTGFEINIELPAINFYKTSEAS